MSQQKKKNSNRAFFSETFRNFRVEQIDHRIREFSEEIRNRIEMTKKILNFLLDEKYKNEYSNEIERNGWRDRMKV